MLHQEIKSGIKEAMMTKNEVLLKALRNMVAAFMTEVMAKGRKPDEFLTDEEVMAVITKLSKQR
ncbi:MAG TPA: GatB/YqeY domain-containing protein, partial [Candidatus Paceibacterota bacterium]